LSNQGFHRLKTRPVKVSAQGEVESQRNDQSKPEPAALFAAREQAFGFEPAKIVKIGYSHCLTGSQHITSGMTKHQRAKANK